MKVRNPKRWQPRRDASKTSADRFHRELEQQNRCGTKKESDDIPGNPLHVAHEKNNHCKGSSGQSCLDGRERRKIMHDGLNPSEKFAWNLIDLQPKEILELCARDNNRNAVGETHDYGARYQFNGRP